MRWQQRARLAVAVFGIAVGGVVFFAVGEREKQGAPPAPERVDPSALVETSRGEMHRVTGTRLDFTVTFERQLVYDRGLSRLSSVRIDVKERQGRDFVIRGREALADEAAREITLTHDVRLAASDGFELSTDTATFREHDGVVRAPGAIRFAKGRMSGRGLGMTYDKNADVLAIADEAEVTLADEEGRTIAAFKAGAATFARHENYLALQRAVRAVRGGQIIEADAATARLTEADDTITYLELRGNARVSGGSAAFDRMAARDIDLDYSDDGLILERLTLHGDASIALTGSGAPGRVMRGEALTLAFAPDGALTSAAARERVQLELPAAGGVPARRIRSGTLDAHGEAGSGLTSARFASEVEFREETSGSGAPRTVRSDALALGLDGDAVSSALFTGRVRFAEQGLTASGAEAGYEPGTGLLRLQGADSGGGPRVADERIAVEASAIDVTLERRAMRARGGVKTVLQGGAATPGLLDRKQPVNVSAQSLEYEGDPLRATYSGSAQLWQGQTAIRADRITIDQASGLLVAAGGARSTLAMDGGTSTGRGEEIRYDDGARQITYEGGAPAPPAASEAPPAPVSRPPAQLSGPQGDLSADRIVVVLGADTSHMERLEAYANITLRLDTRRATGARLTYHGADERYVMSGAAAVPVNVVEPCRETTGKTLTFFKSTEQIIVDGNEEIRTRTKSGGPCPQAPPSR